MVSLSADLMKTLLIHRLVCTVNGGTKNGVQCFKPTSHGLVQIPNTNRALYFTETNPPTKSNTSYSVSTILFSPDGSKLVVDVKGLVDTNAPGLLTVWEVNGDGSLSQNHQSFPAQTNGGQQSFGMTHLDGKEGYVIADVAQGALIFDFSKGYAPTYKSKNVALPGFILPCWISYASKSDS